MGRRNTAGSLIPLNDSERRFLQRQSEGLRRGVGIYDPSAPDAIPEIIGLARGAHSNTDTRRLKSTLAEMVSH